MKIHIAFLLPIVLVTIAASCCLMAGCLFGGASNDYVNSKYFIGYNGAYYSYTNSYEWISTNSIRFVDERTHKTVTCCGSFFIQEERVAEKPPQ